MIYCHQAKQNSTTRQTRHRVGRKFDLMLQMLQYCYILKSLLTAGFCGAIMEHVWEINQQNLRTTFFQIFKEDMK